MGGIIYWALIRLTVTILVLWYLTEQYENRFWWIIVALSFYLIVIHPAITEYKIFVEKNKNVLEDTLCANCKHFDKSAVLCMKHDKHPTKDYIPCDGIHWEPN